MFTIPNNNESSSRYLTYEQMNLINTFRGLNLDLAIMGRMMVTDIILDSPCSNDVFSRMMQIPYAAFNNFAVYYGDEASQQIYGIMCQNIIIMRNLTYALMERDEQRAAALLEQWHSNIDTMSDAFAGLSPYWVREQWHSLLSRYVQLNFQQIMALLTGECAQSLNIFDRIKALTVLIGDYQARGIMWGLSKESINEPATASRNEAYNHDMYI